MRQIYFNTRQSKRETYAKTEIENWSLQPLSHFAHQPSESILSVCSPYARLCVSVSKCSKPGQQINKLYQAPNDTDHQNPGRLQSVSVCERGQEEGGGAAAALMSVL